MSTRKPKKAEQRKLWQCKSLEDQLAWMEKALDAGMTLTDSGLFLGGVDNPEGAIERLIAKGVDIERTTKKVVDAAEIEHDDLAWRVKGAGGEQSRMAQEGGEGAEGVPEERDDEERVEPEGTKMMAPAPLNGTKTHRLSRHALGVLKGLMSNPTPTSIINPGVTNRLLREHLVEMTDLPSPFKTHKGGTTPHLVITSEGRLRLAGT